MPDMVETVIDSVRVSLMSPQRVVILRQTDMERYLPIWVGPYEAESITVALQEVEMARPLTHDLLKNIFTTFGGRILRIEIVAMKEDVFYGAIIAERDGQVFAIDSRPSDAIALAVRAHVPILVSQDVMDSSAIIPERDLQQTPPPDLEPEPPTEPVAPLSEEEDLEVFEDFLKKLENKDDDEDKPKS